MNETRLIDLETKIAHQEVLLEELNQVIYQQQKTLDQLDIKLTGLLKRFQEAAGGAPEIGPANEKPPHY